MIVSNIAYTKHSSQPGGEKKSIPAQYAITFVASMFATMTNAYRLMTIMGMTEYIRQQTGEQMNGIISAIGGFSYKCGTALSNAILAGMLAVTGYIPLAIGQESEAFMVGINSVRFLVPLAATVLYIIFIQFYLSFRIFETSERIIQGREKILGKKGKKRRIPA